MGVGIEIYKSDGRLSVSSSDWSTRLLGSRNTGASNGSITINKNANQFAWIAISAASATSSNGVWGRMIPVFSIQNNATTAVIKWEFKHTWEMMRGTNTPVTFLYGLMSK